MNRTVSVILKGQAKDEFEIPNRVGGHPTYDKMFGYRKK